MSERLDTEGSLVQMEEAIRKSLKDIKRRSENPGLLDRAALLVDRPVVEGLARMWGINPDEIE